MTRFLCLPLLLLFALPTFAQDEPATTTGRSLPRDPAFLMRMKEQLTFDYREIQRVIELLPNDAQTAETLKARQADIAKQLNEVTSELQSLRTPSPNISELLPGTETRLDLPPGTLPVQSGVSGMPSPYPYRAAQVPTPNVPYQVPMPEPLPMGVGMNGYGSVQGGYVPGAIPTTPPSALPFNPANPMTNPYLLEQAQAFETAHWGPRLPRELIEVKESVESLQTEISSLKDTIKTLEKQIQLLTSTVVLLSGPVNERVRDRTRDSEENFNTH